MIYIDIALFSLFAVAFPIVSFYSYRRQLRLARTGKAMEKVAMYRHTVRAQWSMAALLLGVWWAFGRDISLLGIPHNPSGLFPVAVGIAAISIGFFAVQRISLRKASQETLTGIRDQIGDVALMIPRTRQDLHGFYRLSLTAGIVEELIWRGYMISILSQWMPIALAAAISVLVFTLAHAYQGLSQLPGVAMIAITLTVIFVLSGSIWLPILVHIAIDAIQGRTSFEINQRIQSLPPGEEQKVSA